MKTSNVLILIAVVVVVGVGLAAYGHYYFKRQADWDDVQKAAIRVDSGLRHETLIALRSKVADLDAALAHYVGGRGDRQKETRVLSIQKAIESLEWAIEHQDGGSAILDGTADFSFYEKRLYLIAEPRCDESVGKLFLSAAMLAQASLTYAEGALTKPDQSATARTVDLNSLRPQCTSKYETYRNQLVARELEHLRKWRIHVDVRAIYNSCRVNFTSDGGPGTVAILNPAKHIDGNEEISLAANRPCDPSKIKVTVNGQVWPILKWEALPDGAAFEYATTILASDAPRVPH